MLKVSRLQTLANSFLCELACFNIEWLEVCFMVCFMVVMLKMSYVCNEFGGNFL